MKLWFGLDIKNDSVKVVLPKIVFMDSVHLKVRVGYTIDVLLLSVYPVKDQEESQPLKPVFLNSGVTPSLDAHWALFSIHLHGEDASDPGWNEP